MTHLRILLILAACSAACGERKSPRPEVKERRAAEAVDGPEIPRAPALWPSESVSLRETLVGFSSVSACLRKLTTKTGPEVVESLADLGYTTVFEDVCRGIDALKKSSAKACRQLSVSSAQHGCLRRLALLTGRPGLCPSAAHLPGRDPLCLAWAERHGELCRAALPDDYLMCLAVLRGTPALCEADDPAIQQRCQAAVARYADAFPKDDRTPPRQGKPYAAKITAELKGSQSSTPVLDLESMMLDRGVFLERVGCQYALEIGRKRMPSSMHMRVEMKPQAGKLTVPFKLPDGRLQVNTEAAAFDSLGGGEGQLTARFKEFRRGAPFEGTVSATLFHEGERLHLEGTFATFIRDLDPLPSRCGASSN